MRPPRPRLQRLLRALLACWMLLVVFEPPVAASSSGPLRTLSAWLSPAGVRPAAPLLAQVASRAGRSAAGARAASRAVTACGGVASDGVARDGVARDGIASGGAAQSLAMAARVAALSLRAGAAPGVDETALPCGDGRYLYLVVQSLLC